MFKTREQMIKEEIGEANYQVLEQLRRVQSRKGIQAIMPYEIKIE
jgi:protease-4